MKKKTPPQQFNGSTNRSSNFQIIITISFFFFSDSWPQHCKCTTTLRFVNSSICGESYLLIKMPLHPQFTFGITSNRVHSSSSTSSTSHCRPPPKNIRRPAPVEPPIVPNTTNGRRSEGAAESPSSSLERNMKPSDFALLRQKSSDALELRQQHLDGRRATMLDEYNKKLKAEGPLEAIKKSQSPTSSFGKSTPPPPAPSLLGKSPTGSLSKTIQPPRTSGSPTFPFQGRESGSANVGSKESLSSTPGTGGADAISERIKSYESISSLSSDCPPRPNSQNQQHHEGEPLYDQVPMEQNDGGEYVYVQSGALGMGTNSSNESGGGRRRRLGTGSSSSRDDLSNAGSTLPMTHRLSGASNARSSIQMQQQFEPESPGRNSNYVNIDYFITTGNSRGGGGDEGRSSSVDSDGEGFAGPVPVLLRAISHDEQLLPITPGSFKKLPVSDMKTNDA